MYPVDRITKFGMKKKTRRTTAAANKAVKKVGNSRKRVESKLGRKRKLPHHPPEDDIEGNQIDTGLPPEVYLHLRCRGGWVCGVGRPINQAERAKRSL